MNAVTGPERNSFDDYQVHATSEIEDSPEPACEIPASFEQPTEIDISNESIAPTKFEGDT